MIKQRLFEWSREQNLFCLRDHVLVAVSGGADSMALLWALWIWRAELGDVTVTAAHFNHNLRGGESQRDEAFVRAFCQEKGIPFLSGHWNRPHGPCPQGLEADAREARYAFLHSMAVQHACQRIATGHTADDNVETVLLNWTRGCGLAGLCGIPPKRDTIVRPLLTCQRTDLLAFLREQGVPHIDDSSNFTRDYTRNRLRQDVIPALRALSHALSERTALMTGYLRADEQALHTLAQQAAAHAVTTDGRTVLDAVHLDGLPDAVRMRVWQFLFVQSGGVSVLGEHHRQRMSALFHAPGSLCLLPGGITARYAYGRLTLEKTAPARRLIHPVSLAMNGDTDVHGLGLTLRLSVAPWTSDAPGLLIACGAVSGALTLRDRRPGDCLRLPKRVTKPLKKWFAERRIPPEKRGEYPVLCDENGLVAVWGLGVHEPFVPKPGDACFHVRAAHL